MNLPPVKTDVRAEMRALLAAVGVDMDESHVLSVRVDLDEIHVTRLVRADAIEVAAGFVTVDGEVATITESYPIGAA